jgi:hypothetical protein
LHLEKNAFVQLLATAKLDENPDHFRGAVADAKLETAAHALPQALQMFKVRTQGYAQDFDRWTDALNAANALKPHCKSLLQDIRILYGEDLIWVYSRSHRYPQYIGAGTYDRLVKLFVEEAHLEATARSEATQ